MTPNRPISSQEMFETYRTQYNQLIENISQISRDQREIFNQMQLNNERLANQIQLNNERLATHYNYNSQNINFLYINLDSIRLNMLDLYRPYNPYIPPTTHNNSSIPPTSTPNTYEPTSLNTPNSFIPTSTNTPTLPNTTPIPSTTPTTTSTINSPTSNTTSTTGNSTRSSNRYNIEFLYSYVPLQESRDLVDVPVYPTLEQINNAVTTLPFSSISNPLNDRCPIGLEYFDLNEMVTQIRQCGHIFCTSEIQEWFQSNVHCPVCRYDIRENSRIDNLTNNNNNNNRTRNRTRSRLRNTENSIFNEVMTQFLNSYLEPSYNIDLSNNNTSTS